MDEQQSGPAARARRPSGRNAKIAARTARSHAFVPYITRNIPYYEVLTAAGLELLENNADTILEEIGIDFRDDAESLKLWKDAGADVQGERVRFPRGMCRSIVRRSAPKEFTQYARNPARNVLIGGNRTVFAPAYGSPFVRSLDEGRRYARIEDFRNFVKLAYMALAQLVNPGVPVIFGSFASSISMQSGAPTFGTPEPALVLYVMAALARRLGVPFRSGGALCASKISDGQAAYESANTLTPTCLAGVNFVLHTAGWLEGGLAMGYEKFVMDADQAGMMHTLLAGVDLSENGQALDAIREVGPGKHFLGCAHTQLNFQGAFYRSPLAANNRFEQWLEEGSKDMTQRANALWKRQLEQYETPPLDPAVDEALLAYIRRRKDSFPDSNV